MKPKLGIQLYTLRDRIQNYEDCDKTFRELYDFGVRVIQISGIGPIPQPQVAELVKKYGFDVCVTHTSFDRMKADIETVIDEHKMINCDCLGIGSMPAEARESAEALRNFIREANEIGKTMKARGCHFAYHNHDFEFQKIDGDKRIIDILIEETDPELFWFIPDTAWIDIGGDDVCECLERMKGRVKVVHFKDYVRKEDGKHKFVELGKGLVDLPAAYKKATELGMPYIVFEQDIDWIDDDPMLACKLSFEYMNEIAE